MTQRMIQQKTTASESPGASRLRLTARGRPQTVHTAESYQRTPRRPSCPEGRTGSPQGAQPAAALVPQGSGSRGRFSPLYLLLAAAAAAALLLRHPGAAAPGRRAWAIAAPQCRRGRSWGPGIPQGPASQPATVRGRCCQHPPTPWAAGCARTGGLQLSPRSRRPPQQLSRMPVRRRAPW